MLSDFKNEIEAIKKKLVSAQNILILTNNNPSYDGVSASLSLYLALQRNGKKVSIVCQKDLTVDYSDLVGIDKIQKDWGGKNFVISLDYQEGAIEKVSYNIENNKFNLVIQPREGSNWQITPESVQYDRQAIDYNLIFLLEIANKENLNTFYPHEQELFSKVDLVSINNSINNEQFASINLHSPVSSSLSELVGQLIWEEGLSFDQDIATNLLKGIYNSTDNLQSEKTTPEALEMVAICLRHGAQRPGAKPSVSQAVRDTFSSLSAQPSQVEEESNANDNQPPDDWLKQPKIYKSSGDLL